MSFLFTCEKRNLKKSFFFFHAGRKIEKKFFPHPFPSLRGHPVKKLGRKFEHIETSSEKRKTRDFDDKIRENKFLYRQSNVDNVNENDDVQNAIDRSESKDRKE